MSDADPTTTPKKDTAGRVRRGLDYALLGGLVLLGAFAAIQFYFAADRTINVWVTREYRPPFKMLFNLVVLLVVGIGLSRQVRRLTGTDDDTETNESSTDATADGGVDSSPSATTGDLVDSEPDAATDSAPEHVPDETVTDASAHESRDDADRS